MMLTKCDSCSVPCVLPKGGTCLATFLLLGYAEDDEESISAITQSIQPGGEVQEERLLGNAAQGYWKMVKDWEKEDAELVP